MTVGQIHTNLKAEQRQLGSAQKLAAKQSLQMNVGETDDQRSTFRDALGNTIPTQPLTLPPWAAVNVNLSADRTRCCYNCDR